MKSRDEAGYNERLFSGGFRTWLHLARFQWVADKVTRLNCPCDAVLELGCFDGKLIDFLPQKPQRYKGFDANWEGGLDQAREKWKNNPDYSFYKAELLEDINLEENERFNLAFMMETLEHLPPDLVDPYLQKIARHLDGYFFITVPNEKGINFLLKWTTKRLFSKDYEKYSSAEVFYAVTGKMGLIARSEHKGFDYSSLVRQVAQYFDVIEVSGHPFSFLPTSICYGIGIVAKSRANTGRVVGL